MTALAQRKGPLRLGRAPDLTSGQRALYLALRHEATRPTVRLRFRTLGLLLMVSSVVGCAAGYWMGRS